MGIESIYLFKKLGQKESRSQNSGWNAVVEATFDGGALVRFNVI